MHAGSCNSANCVFRVCQASRYCKTFAEICQSKLYFCVFMESFLVCVTHMLDEMWLLFLAISSRCENILRRLHKGQTVICAFWNEVGKSYCCHITNSWVHMAALPNTCSIVFQFCRLQRAPTVPLDSFILQQRRFCRYFNSYRFSNPVWRQIGHRHEIRVNWFVLMDTNVPTCVCTFTI